MPTRVVTIRTFVSSTFRSSLSFFLISALFLTAAISVPAVTFTGTGTGTIADGIGAAQVNCGAARDISFNVAGFPGQVGGASVSFTMAPEHTWVGDLHVSLIAPNATSHVLFARVGANNATDVGDNANLDGTYTFNDLATSNIWTSAASSNNGGFDIPNTSYRTQGSGPIVGDSPGPAFTSIATTFSAVPPANVNGTWTLRFLDCASGDTGTISAASLTLVPLAAGDAELSGSVETSYGAGIRNAVIILSGGNLAQPRTAVTGTFGRYSFDGLDVGQTYIVTVQSKRFGFEQPSQIVNLSQNLQDVNFVANR